MRILLTVLFLVSGSLVLTACYEDVDVSIHEPGEYKGQKDPLLSELKQQQLQKELDERFKAGQSDR